MSSANHNPQRAFLRLVAATSSPMGKFVQEGNTPDLPLEVIAAASRYWNLVPRIRGTRHQISIECATSNLTQLDYWSQQFPDCNWALRTGSASGVMALDVGAQAMATIQTLGDIELPDTLRAHSGGRTIAFLRYPFDLIPVQKGTVVLTPGLLLRGEDAELILPTHVSGAWPDIDASVLPPPDWLIRCAFQQLARPAEMPPRMEIVGGTEWQGGKPGES
jgi:hypothetical protein